MGVNLLKSVEQVFRDQQHTFVFQQDNMLFATEPLDDLEN